MNEWYKLYICVSYALIDYSCGLLLVSLTFYKEMKKAAKRGVTYTHAVHSCAICTRTNTDVCECFFIIEVEVLKRERKKIVTINSHVKENCLQSREQPYYLCWVLFAVQRDCVLTVWNVLCVHYYNKLFIFLRSFLCLIGKNAISMHEHTHARSVDASTVHTNVHDILSSNCLHHWFALWMCGIYRK